MQGRFEHSSIEVCGKKVMESEGSAIHHELHFTSSQSSISVQ